MMKKVLVAVALVGLVAAPALADLAPIQLPQSATSVVDLGTKGDTSPRSNPFPFGYKPNSQLNVFDNNWGDPFGPLIGGPAAYGAAASPYIGGATFVFDDMDIAPSFKTPAQTVETITNINWIFYNPGLCGTAGTHQITLGFFSMPGANTVGAQIIAYSATFSCGFFYAGLDISVVPAVLPANFWFGVRHSALGPTQVFGSAGLPVHSLTGTGSNPTAKFHGNGDARMKFLTTFYGSQTNGSGQLMVLLTKAPEPTTIGLMVLGGLLILRRRKA